MKKLAYFVILCMLLPLFCIGITGCNGSNPDELTGTYYAYEYNYDTESYEINYDYYIQIDTDSKGSVFYGDTGHEINFTISDYKIKFEDFSVGWSMSKGAIRDGILRIGHQNMWGDTTLYFCKKGVTPFIEYNNIQYGLGMDGFYEIVKPIEINITDAILQSEVNGTKVTTIGIEAFRGCKNLTSVSIPDSIVNIEWSAFSGCEKLSDITLPSNLKEIANSVFYGCSSLKAITIPDSVSSIGEFAFARCTSLRELNIPKSVTMIHAFVLSYSYNVESLTVSPDNTVYHSVNNCVVLTEAKSIVLGCKNSIIPTDGSVTSIGSFSFEGCSGLTKIDIPDCISYIGMYAFSSCSSLKDVTISNSVTTIESLAFSNCTSLSKIVIPDSITVIDGLFMDCSNLTEVYIPNSVTCIFNGSFDACSSLKEITIPVSVTKICYIAFADCSSLKIIYYEGTIEQWDAIEKESDWHRNTSDFTIVCTDGNIEI